jgi:hypothetical protein
LIRSGQAQLRFGLLCARWDRSGTVDLPWNFHPAERTALEVNSVPLSKTIIPGMPPSGHQRRQLAEGFHLDQMMRMIVRPLI